MLPIKLNNKPTKIQQTICCHRKSPIFKSHTSYKKSMTYNNGIEMARHQIISKIQIYFVQLNSF
jgi:IS30 family transposase